MSSWRVKMDVFFKPRWSGQGRSVWKRGFSTASLYPDELDLSIYMRLIVFLFMMLWMFSSLSLAENVDALKLWDGDIRVHFDRDKILIIEDGDPQGAFGMSWCHIELNKGEENIVTNILKNGGFFNWIDKNDQIGTRGYPDRLILIENEKGRKEFLGGAFPDGWNAILTSFKELKLQKCTTR